MAKLDDYIKLLEKRASDFDGGKTGPSYNHDENSARVADQEHTKNLSDNRATLGTMFAGMDSASKAETAFSKKWFPSSKPHETSSMLIKTAADRELLTKVAMAVLSTSPKFASATPSFQLVAVQAFQNELEKIAHA